MSKKLTIDFVKSEFERKGWELTSTEYVNCKTHLKYICPKGHKGTTIWSNWRRKAGCPICSGKKKHTIEFIRKEFEKEGWVCVSTEYINAFTKLNYICSNGHHGSITWDNWNHGNRCAICAGNKKPNIDFVRAVFEKEKCVLVSTVYINSDQKLDYICTKGHKSSITWSHWQRGDRCQECYFISRVGSGHWNWQGGISKEPYCQDWTKDLKEFVKERDQYKCINPYCNSKSPDKLAVHHINYNKKTCGPENLITICRSCNTKANHSREWHEAWYKAIMYRRYNII